MNEPLATSSVPNPPSRQLILAQLGVILNEETAVTVDQLEESVAIREGLGVDSVDLVGVIMRVEAEYKIRLTHPELEQIVTVRDLIDLIVAKSAVQA